MAWNFNFCSPHLNQDQLVNLYRTLLLIQLLIGGLVTFVVHMLAQLYDQQANLIKNEANPLSPKEAKEKELAESAYSLNKQLEHSHMSTFQLAKTLKAKEEEEEDGNVGFFRKNKIFFLSTQTVENKAPCFFGHFAIAVGGCMMYCPFLYQTIMGFAYLLVSCLMLIFQAWKMERSLKISVGLGYLLMLGMTVSITVGVGLANWDQYKISCYYTSLFL